MKSRCSSIIIGLFCLLQAATLRAQVVNIEDQRINGTVDSIHWYGDLHGGVALSKVDEKSLQVHAESKIQYKNGRHLTLLLLDATLLRAGDQDYARQAFAHLRYNYKLSNKWIWEAFTQIQTSPIQQLQQRNLVGTGLRYRVFKSNDGRHRVYLGAAWLYEHNTFTEPSVSRSWNRSSNYVSITIRPTEKISLVNTTYWQPVIGLIRNYRLSSQWRLNFELTKKLSFEVAYDYSIDKNLPVGAPGETYSWRNGFSFQF